MTQPQRRILVVVHAHRGDNADAARRVMQALRAADAQPVLAPEDRADLDTLDLEGVATLGVDVDVDDIELAIVLGGDGTILRAAELVREGTAPVLGINMGHVGFLAEIERDDMDDAVHRVIARDYEVEERLALSVRVKDAADTVIYETWALNEATVEKASRERMLEVVIEIDGRPLSSFGCDGVVVSTPTGSTAYGFSGGGPIVWPTVEALSVVPLSAHALFARPLVVEPGSRRGDRGARSHQRCRHPVVRRPAFPRSAARRARGRASLDRPGAPRAPAPGGVHRPPRAQVPSAGQRLAGTGRPRRGGGPVTGAGSEVSA